ncbi:MAG: hypothetical protein H6740_02540 [Alphaproteobacteria bacterium]|nr:hypothetical protein [Alphaproteobacteria bacterium]
MAPPLRPSPRPPTPAPEALAEALAAQTAVIEAEGRLPLPALSAAQWAEVAAGEVVKLRRTDADGVDTAIGVGFVPHPIDQVWVGVLDDVHDDLVSNLSETWLPGTTPGHKVLYQHLDLPMPFSDRHWVIIIENTRGLHAASGGAVWERVWDLDPRGAAAFEDVPAELVQRLGSGFTDAIVTPINAGGWYFIPTAGGVLTIYQVRTDIGGNIPDELVVRYALSTLDELIEHVAELPARAPAHYRGTTTPIVRPDGSAIPGW